MSMQKKYPTISGADLPEQFEALAWNLLKLLKEAEPRKKWYTGKFLANHLSTQILSLTDVHLRAIVNFLRRHHEPIISSSAGYRYSSDIEEIRECIDDLRAREGAIREARKGLESVLARMATRNQESIPFGEP
jgi:hypothetical protein